MPKVFTTIRPDVELEVDDGEVANLRSLGILLESSATTEKGRTEAAAKQLALRSGRDPETGESTLPDTPVSI